MANCRKPNDHLNEQNRIWTRLYAQTEWSRRMVWIFTQHHMGRRQIGATRFLPIGVLLSGELVKRPFHTVWIHTGHCLHLSAMTKPILMLHFSPDSSFARMFPAGPVAFVLRSQPEPVAIFSLQSWSAAISRAIAFICICLWSLSHFLAR